MCSWVTSTMRNAVSSSRKCLRHLAPASREARSSPADGHHGHLGSEAAVEAILQDFAAPWTATEAPARSEAEWRDQAFAALLRANRAVLEAAARHGLPPAPTTFVMALARPGEDLLLHLSVGDSHLFAVDQAAAIELGGRDPEWKFTPFLGYEEASRDLLERYARVGQRGLEELRAIVLATDGLSEQLLVGVGAQADVARARQQLAERRVAGQVGLQDERVHEAADQSLRLDPRPVGHGRADDEVLLTGVAVEQGLECREQGHEERGALAAGQLL